MRDLRFLYKAHYTASRALVIGIDQYSSAPPLSYAVSDATAVAETLVSSLGFKESEVTVLTDQSATKAAILRAFLRFANDDVELDERVVVFFAGHGRTRVGLRGDIGYLVPYDASMADASTFIRWDELTRNADIIRAKHVLFIMDACYGGLALARTFAPGSARYLKDMLLRTSRQVLTAGKANETVSDSGGPLPNHSVFTGHLILALRGAAATSDGVLTASGVMAYVHARVANDNESRQTPHYGQVDGDGDMILQAPSLSEPSSSETKDSDRLVSIPYPEATVEYLSISAKISRAKALLASEAGAIGLHDMLIDEVRRFLALTTADSFATSDQFSQEALLGRVSRYEVAAQDLSLLLACVAQWGSASHLATLQKCIARSCDRLDPEGGLTVWIALRWYPLIVTLYSAGIAAVDARRYDSLSAIFLTPLPKTDFGRNSRTFVEGASEALLEINRSDVLKRIPGHERQYAPHSEYLLKTLQPRLDDTLFLGKNYETAFETFEVLFALCAADARVARGKEAWGPIGRFGWKRGGDDSPFGSVLREAEAEGSAWPPVKAGLFGGSYERFVKIAEEYKKVLGRLNWH
jgi:Caspase domain